MYCSQSLISISVVLFWFNFRYLGPGGLGDYGKHFNCTGGAAGYIDKQVLGTSHLYTTPTCTFYFLAFNYDPEGVLGCLTSIVMTYLGVACGRVIVYHKDHKARLLRWVIWGIVLGSIAGLLCEFKQDGGWLPLNKNMWSVSFIFAQAGDGFLALSLCYVLVDIFKVWTGAPFVFLGMNSIAIYVGSEMLQMQFPFTWNYASPTHAKLLLTNLVGVGCLMLIAIYMDHLKFYVKI